MRWGPHVPAIVATVGAASNPVLYPGFRDGADTPCLQSASNSSMYRAYLDLSWFKDDLAFLNQRGPSKLRIITKGSGSPASGGGFNLAKYQAILWAPATYTPTTGPNGNTGTIDASTVRNIACSTLTTDAHLADASDWTSAITTTLTLAAPSYDVSPEYGRCPPMLYVELPYSTAGATYQIFAICPGD